MIYHYRKDNKGFSIVEIVITIAIISGVLISLLQLGTFTLRTISGIEQSNQANMIAQGTMEAVRNFRDNTTWDIDGIGTLSSGTIYHPEVVNGASSTQWSLIVGEGEDGGYAKRVVFSDVSRDPVTYDIEDTYNMANDDPDTRKVTVTVSWSTRQVRVINYLTNWQ